MMSAESVGIYISNHHALTHLDWIVRHVVYKTRCKRRLETS